MADAYNQCSIGIWLKRSSSSSIINGGEGFNEKARSVNSNIVKLCHEKILVYLDKNNVGLNHLQQDGHWGGLHLNNSRTGIFKNNIVNIINCWYGKASVGVTSAQDAAQSNSSPTVDPQETDGELSIGDVKSFYFYFYFYFYCNQRIPIEK